MKQYGVRLLLTGLLSLALLTACGEAAPKNENEETTKVRDVTELGSAEAEADMALCKEAVRNIQREEFVELQQLQQNQGEDVLNETSTITFLKSGEDLYRCVSIPIDAYLDETPIFTREHRLLRYDGAYFNDFYNGYTTADDTGEQTHWGESTMSEQDELLSSRAPWLLSFDWEAQEVRYVSTVQIGEQKAVRLQIFGEYLPNTICDSYTAEFYFDQEDQLDHVETVASYVRKPRAGIPEEHGPAIQETSTQRVISADQTRITRTIEEAYQQALEDVRNRPEEEDLELSGGMMA